MHLHNPGNEKIFEKLKLIKCECLIYDIRHLGKDGTLPLLHVFTEHEYCFILIAAGMLMGKTIPN